MRRFYTLEQEIGLRLSFKSVIQGPEGVEGLLRGMGELNESLRIAAEVLTEYYDEQEKKKQG